MTRRSLSLMLALLLAGCSKPSSDGPLPEASQGRAPLSAHPSGSAVEAPGSTAAPILTPEDVEAETEHRITEQNLESELDRLEREIQAE
jgi:hypothetical protein